MAARKKSAKKTPAGKPGKAKKTSRPAAPSKKKTASRKKAPAKKPASRATRPKAAAAAKPLAKPAAAPAPPAPRPADPPPVAGAVGANDVLLSHVMALRPRIHVGFKPSAFSDAKRALADQRYATLQDAARAVAEKAIEISNEFSPRSPFER